jgi:hypothetical protein
MSKDVHVQTKEGQVQVQKQLQSHEELARCPAITFKQSFLNLLSLAFCLAYQEGGSQIGRILTRAGGSRTAI